MDSPWIWYDPLCTVTISYSENKIYSVTYITLHADTYHNPPSWEQTLRSASQHPHAVPSVYGFCPT